MGTFLRQRRLIALLAGGLFSGACTLLTPLSDYAGSARADGGTSPEDATTETPIDSSIDAAEELAPHVDAADAEGGCPCTLFGETFFGTPSDPDPASAELGVRFTSNIDAVVAGVRFYRGPENVGPHTGSLWSVLGERLATGPFTNETPLGWQTMRFETPVPIAANTPYIVSYHTASGHYASAPSFFTKAVDVPPLHADTVNGVFTYEADAMPAKTFEATNYWVDVIIE